MTASRLLNWNNEWIKKALSDGKREEQPNMDGNLLAKRIELELEFFICHIHNYIESI